MPDGLDLRRRLSMNQATVPRWSTPELLEGCARAGYGGAGLWRHRIQDIDLATTSKLAQGLEIQISSLCRGGFFLVAGDDGLDRAEDNRRAVDQASELHAQTLVLVCGPAPDRDLRGAREAVADAIADLALYTRAPEHAARYRTDAPAVLRRPVRCGDPRSGALNGGDGDTSKRLERWGYARQLSLMVGP